MSRWIGVASASHVREAVAGGFCQLTHGTEGPLTRLARGDHILYYAPREATRAGAMVQAFTAIGEILDDAPYRVHGPGDFHPYRRSVRYFDAEPVPIRPILGALSFTRGKAAWGRALRHGLFRIDDADYRLIAKEMGVRDDALVLPVSVSRQEDQPSGAL